MTISRPLRAAAGTALALATLALPVAAAEFKVDLSPEQPGRVRAAKVAAAIRQIPKDAHFVKDGVLTVAINGGRLPLAAFATDTQTLVGSDPDIAQLVADSLGRKLEIVNVAWADWPLGLSSGKYDAVISNVTVTEARKEKFDFSTYRQDKLGIYVKSTGPVKQIRDPKDIAGLRVIVGASTNQEQILLRWNQQNVAAGLKPVEVQYYDDDVVQRLAIQSGRADAYLGPNAIAAFEAAKDGKTRLAGTFSGGWPLNADIAVTTRKGSGLAAAITTAINVQIGNGNYARTLKRWNLGSEAITQSQTNPAGLPKS
ncbi:ABC transporter substrate-binding protein [Vogesella sp. LIG4]|uniref:ABC transporter substrate-binding protein n=1 Tax=Vogesella sp. LIG4 TaxID=1192162 RepID=UPI00081F9473|nr:ABC transporter substrate-binding protein [Vogesella sp. LIG4]SCK26707.1 polar amino acid transport system substrate-binding protein [Vogesella sp. LIG4]